MNDTTKIKSEILATIKGVHVEYTGPSPPESYIAQIQDYIEGWLYEIQGEIKRGECPHYDLETWRIAEELHLIERRDETLGFMSHDLRIEEAQRRAIVEFIFLKFLQSTDDNTDWSERISVSPIT